MRSSLLPTLVVLLLLGLVYLLPQRSDPPSALPTDLRLPAPELMQPPAWALPRGEDEIERNLDRLVWGGHGAMQASREVLKLHRGELAQEVLGRLARVGESDPIQVSKLIDVLGDEDGAFPGQLDELVRRSASASALVAKAALRVLAFHADDRAMAGIWPALLDPRAEVRTTAHAALAHRALRGDAEARRAVLEALQDGAVEPGEPYEAYLLTLEDFTEDAPAAEILARVAREGTGLEQLIALAALARGGDPDGVARLEQQIASGDRITRINALRVAATAGRPLAEVSWDEIVSSNVRDEVLSLASVLLAAIDGQHASATHALSLVESLAQNPGSSVQVEMIDVLFEREHAWALEQTRREIGSWVGGQLSQSADRVLRYAGARAPEFAALALRRLEAGELRDQDKVTLGRLLVALDPERAAELLVPWALGQEGASPTLASAMAPVLADLGTPGVRRLAREVDSPRGRELFFFVAGLAGSPEALPVLEELALDEALEPAVRAEALAGIVRVEGGPRVETLHRVAEQILDPVLREQARLLFWNYL